MINKINSNLTTTKKISDLNDFIIELNGKYSQGTFNKIEIDEIYSNLDISRKYLRNQLLGHTLSTYTGWTHLQSEVGYSIWKYSPTNYVYNALNQLYMDDKVLENVGLANTESEDTFNKVFIYDGDSGSEYIDNTSEAASESGTEFSQMNSDNDYLYLGLDVTFAGVKFEFQTRGSNYTNKIEYFNGSTWVEITANSNGLVDNTSNFESDGNITWTIPTDWTQVTINSEIYYWIRISSSTVPVTVAKAYYIVPNNSVISLLALSSSQVQNEECRRCGGPFVARG